MNAQQFEKVKESRGFIAALDQSGGSTPKALLGYGVSDDSYSSSDEMFDLIHEMRTRIITSPSFEGDRLFGAILFENTIDREIEGMGSVEYLWETKGVVPFLKIDKGLENEAAGVQVMRPIPDLDATLAKGRELGVFGTKMRSVIKLADPGGIEDIVEQQFELGERILEAGLVPILEPEVDINSPQKTEAEDLLNGSILKRLDRFEHDTGLMFKLTIPTRDNLYRDLVDHPKVVRVAALSGGYTHDEACEGLARQRGMVASFSRALVEGLSVGLTDEEFDRILDRSVANIFAASST